MGEIINRNNNEWAFDRVNALWQTILQKSKQNHTHTLNENHEHFGTLEFAFKNEPSPQKCSWRTRAGRQEAWESYLEKLTDNAVKRDLGALYDPKFGLGLQLRWNIAAFELFDRAYNNAFNKEMAVISLKDYKLSSPPGKKNQAKELRALRKSARAAGKEAAKNLRNEIENTCGFLDDFFQLGSLQKGEPKRRLALRDAAATGDNLHYLCEKLTLQFGDAYKKGGAILCMNHALFTAPLFGVNAPADFLALIRTGVRPLVSNASLLLERTFEVTDKREIFLADLSKRINSENRGCPIISVHADGSRRGLEAFARHWLAIDDSQRRPKIVIPCGPGTPPYTHRGLSYLVANLLAFFEHGELRQEPDILTQAQISNGIEKIREYLCRHSVIIVFVGHEVHDGDGANLRRAIVDEPLLQLLSHLVHPNIGDPDNLTAIDVFEKTFFVVLADGPMDTLKAYSQEPLVLPQPRPERLVQILYRDNYAQATNIESGLAKLDGSIFKRLPSEAEVDALEQLCTLQFEQNVPLTQFVDVACSGPAELLYADLYRFITETASPFENLMLSCIACSETGMRRRSLWRAAHTASAALGSQLSLPEEARDNVIDSLLARYGHLLFEANGETSVQATARDDAPSSNRTLHFRHGAVRASFIQAMDSATRRLIHRVLCALALDQHISWFRHSEQSERVTVRGYRLALEALFHGFKSLPPSLDDIDDTWSAIPISSLLPPCPKALFRFLYWDLFRRLIEARSQRRMSRQWAADNIKLDIVLLAHRAFGGSETSAFVSGLPAWADTKRFESTPDLLREHFDAIAVSAYRTSDVTHLQKIDLLMRDLVDAGSEKTPPTSTRSALGLDESNAPILPVLQRTLLDIKGVLWGGKQGSDACRAWLKKLAFLWQALEKAPWRRRDQKDAWYLIAHDEVNAFVDGYLGQMRPPRGAVRAWINLLVRVAEYQYQDALLLATDQSEKAVSLIEAYALLRTAQCFADIDAQHRPLEAEAVLPAKGLRIVARVSMALLSELNVGDALIPVSENPARETWARYLRNEVRATLDQYALHNHSFAPDAVSVLLLEARFLRISGKPWLNDTKEPNAQRTRRHYERALRCIQDAESRLIRFQSRPKLRLRLLVERCAALRNLALAIFRDGQSQLSDTAHKAARLAAHDVQQLDNLVRALFEGFNDDTGDFWRMIVNAERKKVARIQATLAPHVGTRSSEY